MPSFPSAHGQDDRGDRRRLDGPRRLRLQSLVGLGRGRLPGPALAHASSHLQGWARDDGPEAGHDPLRWRSDAARPRIVRGAIRRFVLLEGHDCPIRGRSEDGVASAARERHGTLDGPGGAALARRVLPPSLSILRKGKTATRFTSTRTAVAKSVLGGASAFLIVNDLGPAAARGGRSAWVGLVGNKTMNRYRARLEYSRVVRSVSSFPHSAVLGARRANQALGHGENDYPSVIAMRFER